MAMKCNRFVINSLIFSYRSVLTSVGERINNEEKKKNHTGSIRSDISGWTGQTAARRRSSGIYR